MLDIDLQSWIYFFAGHPAEVHLKPSQTSLMKLFAKTAKSRSLFLHIYIWPGPKYASTDLIALLLSLLT